MLEGDRVGADGSHESGVEGELGRAEVVDALAQRGEEVGDGDVGRRGLAGAALAQVADHSLEGAEGPHGAAAEGGNHLGSRLGDLVGEVLEDRVDHLRLRQQRAAEVVRQDVRDALEVVVGDGEGALAALELDDAAAELQLVDDLPAQPIEGIALGVGEGPLLEVDDADRAQRHAGRVDDVGPGVGAQAVGRHHEHVLEEAPVGQGVLDREHLARLAGGVGAEAVFDGGLGGGEAVGRLKPEPVAIDEGDDRGRRAAELARESREVVEGLLGAGVEDTVVGENTGPVDFRRRARHRRRGGVAGCGQG